MFWFSFVVEAENWKPYVQNANYRLVLVNSIPSMPNKIGSLFGKSPSSGKKLSKGQMSDVIGYTTSALAALQKGDGVLGKQQMKTSLNILT